MDERIAKVRAIIAEAVRQQNAKVIRLHPPPPPRRRRTAAATVLLVAAAAALLLTADSGKIIFHQGFYPRIADSTPWKVSAECEPFFKSLRDSGSSPPMARPEQASRIERWL